MDTTEYCVEVAGWHELRASLPASLPCTITHDNTGSFEKYSNRSDKTITVCVRVACAGAGQAPRFSVDRLWLGGTVPQSAVPLILAVVLVLWWYAVAGCRLHRSLLYL
jgi:hypothetical protein